MIKTRIQEKAKEFYIDMDDVALVYLFLKYPLD